MRAGVKKFNGRSLAGGTVRATEDQQTENPEPLGVTPRWQHSQLFNLPWLVSADSRERRGAARAGMRQ